jgi:outer membrane murein-binding lipoprotein Lpp
MRKLLLVFAAVIVTVISISSCSNTPKSNASDTDTTMVTESLDSVMTDSIQ